MTNTPRTITLAITVDLYDDLALNIPRTAEDIGSYLQNHDAVYAYKIEIADGAPRLDNNAQTR